MAFGGQWVSHRPPTAMVRGGVSWRVSMLSRQMMCVLFIVIIVVGLIGFASMVAFVLR
jgi:hypothetical protein